VKPAAAFGPAELADRLAALIEGFPRARVAVAFSGGGDSAALLAALAVLAKRRRSLALRAVHIDHGLQRSSRSWARHCARVAGKLGVPLLVRRVKVPAAKGQSLEAEARRVRYTAFARLLAPGESLLTGHHLEDQAETVLLQLLRGAGVAGLAAMPPDAPLGRGRLVRPLLEVPRAALRDYARQRGLEWIEDPMNLDARFDRAYVRGEVLPRLEARWPSAARALARSARHARDAQGLLAQMAADDLAAAADGPDLSVAVLRRLPDVRRRNVLRAWIRGQGARAPETRRLAEISGPLLAARADARPRVAWEDGAVRRAQGRLVWEGAPAQAAPPGPLPCAEWSWRERPVFWLPGARGRVELRRDARGDLDLDALPAVLGVRWRTGGERLRPRIGGPSRPVKDLLQAARIAPWERAAMPLVYAGEKLVAVVDRWVDAAWLAGAGSRARGRFVWHRTPRRARPGGRDLIL
jgi:tRNA(Ile)-lysidine synthase